MKSPRRNRTQSKGAHRPLIRSPRAHRLRLETLEVRDLLATDLLPLGSLIESSELGNGTIAAGGQIDTFTLDLDANQTISVVAESSGGLAPTITVTGPGIAESTSATANTTAVLNTVQVATAGNYTVSISGTAGTLGDYVATATINALIDVETYGGAANNTPASAVALASASLELDAADTARTAVLGDLAAADVDYFTFTLDDGESASLALGAEADGLLLNLYDASGTTLLASGVAVRNVVQSIAQFVGTTSNGPTQYLAQVSLGTAPANTAYSLIVTNGMDFETEPNLSFGTAQRALRVLGNVTTEEFSGTAVLSSFAGMDSNSTDCGCEPPDTHGAVGPDHYIEVVNTAIGIYHKDGTVAQPPVEFDAFFAPVVGGDGFIFDPVVAYDAIAGRFVVAILSAVSSASATSDLLYAVSDTSDPTQGFTEQHRIDFGNNGLFADYPKIGYNADAHVFSLNMFGSVGFDRVDVVSIDKPDVLDANPAGAFDHTISSRSISFTMAVASMPASQPGDPIWLVEETGFSGPGTDVRVVRMDDPGTTSPSFADFTLPVEPYNSGFLPAAPQPGGTFRTNDSRMLNAESRGDRLVSTHTVDLGGKAIVRWYDFDVSAATPTLSQQGNIDPGPGVATYFPSIALNAQGDIGITYMQSSSSEFVSMYVTGQAFGSVPNSLAEPQLVRAGNESYPGGRGGDYSGISVDPGDDSFWAANEVSLTGAPNPLWSTHIANFVVAPLADNDWYRIPVNVGDELSIATYTPFAGTNAILNDVDPTIELYAPDSSFISADDNSGSGLNATLGHTATQTGDYRVLVGSVDSTTGAYQLIVSGSSAIPPSPAVVAMTPAGGMALAEFPSTVQLDFSTGMLLSSLTTSDVLIGGLPAIARTVIDGDSVRFTIDPAANVGDRSYAVVLAEGDAVDLGGNAIVGFSGSFVLDTTGPVVESTRWNGGTFPANGSFSPGPLTFTADFNEDLFTLASARRGLRTPGTEDVVLTETATGAIISATSVEYDPVSFDFTADFGDLSEGNYELRLISGDGAFEDEVGNDLDGDSSGSGDGTPTGNGVNGGDFVVSFIVDRDSTPVGTSPFSRLELLGSLASGSTGNSGFVNFVGDEDPFAPVAETGELVSFLVQPGNATATLSLTFQGTTRQAAAAGRPVVLDAQAVLSSGPNSVVVGGDIASDYSISVFRNATIGGLLESALPIPIDNGRLRIAEGNRWAAVGQASGSVGTPQFELLNTAGLFIDISSTGTALGLSDDGEVTITSSVGNSLFPAGSVTVANNGGIIAGVGEDLSTGNTALPSGEWETALLPFWTDIDSDTGNVYWEERVVGGISALIVQWENRPHFSNTGSATFQVQVFESGPVAARFAYEDVIFGDGNDNGAGATIGYQASSDFAVQFSFNEAAVENGDALDLRLVAPTTDVDEFGLSLAENSPVDVVLAAQQVSFAGQKLELVDPLGNIVATADSSPLGPTANGFDLGILDFVPAMSGNYTIRLSADATAEFQLVVSQALTLDIEPNNLPGAALRSLNATRGALGYLGGESAQFVQLNDPEKFIDISSSGTALGLSDDGEVTITTTVGNELFPAGSITVANNGGILAEPNADLSTANTVLPSASWNTALLPFWTDIDSDTGNVYWQELVVDGINTLIVQWDNRPHFSNTGSATFQVQVFASGQVAARFAYEDVIFGSTDDNAGGATIGYQASSSAATQFSFNAPVLNNGDVLDLFTTDTDLFEIALAAGDAISLQTSTPLDIVGRDPGNDLDPQLGITGPGGTALTDANSGGDGKNARIDFVASGAGTYVIAVSTASGVGEYVLTAAFNSPLAADFDQDGDVDGDDFLVWQNGLGTSSGAALADGDADGDGDVDGDDFLLWQQDFDAASGGGAAAANRLSVALAGDRAAELQLAEMAHGRDREQHWQDFAFARLTSEITATKPREVSRWEDRSTMVHRTSQRSNALHDLAFATAAQEESNGWDLGGRNSL